MGRPVWASAPKEPTNVSEKYYKDWYEQMKEVESGIAHTTETVGELRNAADDTERRVNEMMRRIERIEAIVSLFPIFMAVGAIAIIGLFLKFI